MLLLLEQNHIPSFFFFFLQNIKALDGFYLFFDERTNKNIPIHYFLVPVVSRGPKFEFYSFRGKSKCVMWGSVTALPVLCVESRAVGVIRLGAFLNIHGTVKAFFTPSAC